MKKEIVGCLILVLLATHGAAQTQPPSAPAQKTAPHPPGPPPAAPSPPASLYCMFEGKEYSIGAVVCVSSQMSQVCSASDSEHARPWWSSGPQSLCATASPARAAVEAPYARITAPPSSPAQPSAIPAQPAMPKNGP
jgi:hypothetical protein